MKFHSIELEAFGVFRDKQTVDFDALNEASLFLIRGNNGAGKTTILDAICFALYGDVPGMRGESRSVKVEGDQAASLKSDYADDSVVPFVALEFTVSGIRYKVRREPAWQKTGKKSAENTKATLHRQINGLWGDPIATKPGDVNMALFGWKKTRSKTEKREPGILGLDIDQFSMIVMLPQGKFSEFLKASSEDRAKLLGAIFPIQDYSRIIDELSVEKNRLGAEIAKASAELDAAVNQLLGAINAEMPDGVLLDDWLSELKASTNLAFKDAKELVATSEQTETQKNIAFAAAESAHAQVLKIADYKRKKRESEECLQGLKQKLEAVGLADFDPSDPKNRSLVEKKVENNQSLLEAIDEHISKLTDLKLKKELAETEGVKADEISQDIEGKKLELKAIDELLATELSVKETMGEKQLALGALNGLAEHLEEIDKASEKVENLRGQLPELELAAQQAKEKLAELRRNELESVSARIANDLHDGEDCPVCGSKVHPKLAKFKGHIPSEEELQSAEDALVFASKALQTKLDEINAAENTAKLLASQLKKNFKVEGEEAAHQALEARAEFRKSIEGLEGDLRRIEDAKSSATNLRESILLLKVDLDNLNIQVAEINGGIKGIELDLKGSKVSKKDLENRDTIFDVLNVATEQLSVFMSVEEEWRTALKDIADADAALVALGNPVALVGEDAVEKARDEAQEAKRAADTARSDLSKVMSWIAAIEKFEKALPAKRAKTSSLQAEYEEIEHVFKVANGQVGMRVNLVNFYLGQRLRQIALLASERLMKMSDNHFYLEHSESSQSGNMKVGLELNLFDTWTMTRRPVGDFSGGELFMASLALALALSDVVKAESGSSVSLDTLFIDEGFGALDPTFTDTVVTVLEELRTYGRTVGLVSHVQEIQDRIPTQLVIEKTKQGSRILPIKIG